MAVQLWFSTLTSFDLIGGRLCVVHISPKGNEIKKDMLQLEKGLSVAL